MKKKAQVNSLQNFVMTIVTITIVLAIGLIVLSEMKGASKEMETSSVSNESVATSGSTVNQGGELFITVSACRNASMTTIPTGIYCNISSTGEVTFDTTNFSSGGAYIDYIHYTPSAAYNSTETILIKMTLMPTWIGIIIIVALSSMVLMYFIGKRQ